MSRYYQTSALTSTLDTKSGGCTVKLGGEVYQPSNAFHMPFFWKGELEQAIQAGRGAQESYARLLDVIESPELRNVVRDLVMMEETNETLLRSLGNRTAAA